MKASAKDDRAWYMVAGLCVIAGILLLVFVAPGNPPPALAGTLYKTVAVTQAQKAAMLANEALLLNPIFTHVYMPIIVK